MRPIRLLALCPLAIVMSLSGARLRAADGRIPISAVPVTLSQPGTYYLTRDFSITSGKAVFISASHVKLDLNGHTLTVQGTTYPSDMCIQGFVAAGVLTDIQVFNGTLVGGSRIIELTLTDGGTAVFNHLALQGQAGTINGLFVGGSSTGFAHVTIENVQVAGVAGACFSVQYINGGLISRNVASRCTGGSGYGIIASNTSSVTFSDNVTSLCSVVGIYLNAASSGNLFTRNNTSGTGDGIDIFGNNNTLDWNQARGAGNGIVIQGNNNIYSNNRTLGAATGILITGGTGNTNAGGNF